MTGEFWHDLSAIYCLTNQGQWELCIDCTTKGYLPYSNFSVGSLPEQYPLTTSGFDEVTDDQLEKDLLNRAKFSTYIQ